MEATSDDPHARLAELAGLADAGRTAFLALAESAWQPAENSAAARAKIDVTAKDPATSSADILAGFDLVSEVVVSYLEVAANHLGGLAALYRSGEVMFSPLPLVRSVLEYCAHAMWVVGDGSGTADDMLARAYLEEFVSSEFAKMAAGRMGSKQDDPHQHAQKRWKAIRERAIAAFPETTPQDLGNRTIGSQTLLSPESAVSWMFGLLNANANGSVNEKQSEGIYSFLSSGTHPSLYQARQMRKYVDRGEYVGTVLKVDLDYLERLLGVGVIAFYNALSYVVSFYGLPAQAHDELTRQIDDTMPNYLKP
ncbi:hypothetical protein M1D51_19535 [Arthrobacter sp. R3-55]